jgi:hypothetical protein
MRELLPANCEKAERVGFEPTRRLDTAYAISNLKRAPYLFRAWRPDLSHCVRLVWHLAAFVEVLTYPGVHCVRSRTGLVAVRLGIGCTIAFAAVLHLCQVRQPFRVQNTLLWASRSSSRKTVPGEQHLLGPREEDAVQTRSPRSPRAVFEENGSLG